jgi:two-component system KDP operon response regulator KdpE
MKQHILLVDDDPAFRSYASLLLAGNGYRVTQACDGRQALQSIEKLQEDGEPVDLLFTDLRMAGMSGLELIRKVRGLGLDLPVLVATGFLDEVSFEELQQIKSHQFLVKPFKPEDLLRHVAELALRFDAGTGKGPLPED